MSRIEQIRKRSGEIVDFDPAKIEVAISKSFDATYGGIDQEIVDLIAQNVVADLEEMQIEGAVPGVEDVQNVVEREIMEAGFYEVARAYIIYRHEHTKVRQEKKEQIARQTQRKLEKNSLSVVKRSGEKEAFSVNQIYQTLQQAASGLNSVDIEGLVRQVVREIYDGISTGDVAKALIMTTRSWIEKDPVYSLLAARLLHKKLYREVIGLEFEDNQLKNRYRQAFIKSIRKGVEIGKLDSRLLEFDLETLSNKLVIERDNLLKYLGAQTLYDRYYIQNPETKEILETPQMMWMRVSMGLAINEKERNGRAIEFYEVMSTLRYVPSTPTLFHAGTKHPQLSSCYLNTVSDDLHHIFKVIGDNAQLSKWSGGIGTDWSYLRGTGALIRGTGVESQGVIPFLKVANDATHAINRSGRRRGAACVYLETWHYDVEAFLELRKNTGDERRRTHDIDTANWIPDLFMKRVRADREWTLFSPDEVADLHDLYGKEFEKRYEEYERMAERGEIKLAKKVRAKDLWKKMLAMLFETGHPWITWKDPANVRSPQDHVGVVHNSNLCTEITLNTSPEETAVCNLGSVNLGLHVKNGKFDEKLLEDTVRVAMRMLDNVVDINFYPTVEAKNSNMKHRPVGLGVMGFQDALYQLGVNFDSEKAVDLADQSQEIIAYYAYLASSELAAERGTYESYRGSKWDRGILPQDTLDLLEQERGEKIEVSRIERLEWGKIRESIQKNGMRNSNCLAIAPTATISNIAGCVPTIEPIYKNIYVKANVSGDFIIINPYMADELKRLGLWDERMLGKVKYYDGSIRQIEEIPVGVRERYKEVFEIDPKWLIKAAAYRGKWIDQSQSLNIYFIGSSGAQLSEVYFYAWSLGLKTTYYLRTLAKSQVEKSTVDTSQYGLTHKREAASKQLLTEQSGAAVRVETGPAEMKFCRLDDPTCESCQ